MYWWHFKPTAHMRCLRQMLFTIVKSQQGIWYAHIFDWHQLNIYCSTFECTRVNDHINVRFVPNHSLHRAYYARIFVSIVVNVHLRLDNYNSWYNTFSYSANIVENRLQVTQHTTRTCVALIQQHQPVVQLMIRLWSPMVHQLNVFIAKNAFNTIHI